MMAQLDHIDDILSRLVHRFDQLEARFNDYHRHNEPLILAGEFEAHDAVKEMMRLLRPYAAIGFHKARFGSARDGGYVLLDDFRGIDTAFSFGIEQNASWDLDIAEKGLTVYQFDHTVDAPITDHPHLIFTRKKISTEEGPETEMLSFLIRPSDHEAVRFGHLRGRRW
jgi:hypothetical protein